MQGELNAKYETAKKMKDLNVDIYIIIQTTGLTPEEIENL